MIFVVRERCDARRRVVPAAHDLVDVHLCHAPRRALAVRVVPCVDDQGTEDSFELACNFANQFVELSVLDVLRDIVVGEEANARCFETPLNSHRNTRCRAHHGIAVKR